MKRDEALRLRAIIEKGMASLDDKTASTVPTLYPALKGTGGIIEAGTRINWKGTIKKAAVVLRDSAENNPDNAPTLWADLEYRDGHRIIPPVITVTTAFALDECGWWGDELYRSLIDANVYTPEQYPAGWELQTR